MQFYLRRLSAYYSDIPTVTVDGRFGAATTRAVKAWQARAGLTVDGVVGRLTFQSLYDAVQALDTSGPVVRTVSLPTPSATLRPGSTGPAVLRLNSAAAVYEPVDTGNQLPRQRYTGQQL